MICKNCKKQINDDSNFCRYCGAVVEKEEIKEYDFNEPDSKFKIRLPKSFFIIIFIILFLVATVFAFTFYFQKKAYEIELPNKITNIEESLRSELKESIAKELKESIELVLEDERAIAEESANVRGLVELDGEKYYCKDSGYYAVSEWVLIDGEYYYFDKEGKMKTDSIIDNQYYVDKTGKMLKNTTIPNGKKVGSDGKIVETVNETTVKIMTNETVSSELPETASQGQGSNIIVQPIKQEDAPLSLYIKTTRKIKDSFKVGNETCTLSVVFPTMAGTSKDETNDINEKLKNIQNDIIEDIKNQAKKISPLPKSVSMSSIKVSSLTNSKCQMNLIGKIERREDNAAFSSLKYRIEYDRKNKKITYKKISK